MNGQKVLAYYFAQYHSFPENDIVFGKGFSDWNLFDKNNPALSESPFPLEQPDGLGYYDPTQLSVRKSQTKLAEKYGVDGFIYYHYWLENKPVMDKVLNNLLDDNEPNLPFCLCFANESWKHCYGPRGDKFKAFHSTGETFRQLYDSPKEHAAYLQKLFHHPNYIRINNLPVLFVYKLNYKISVYLDEIIKHLKNFNIENIYYIANTSRYCLKEYNSESLVRNPDAYSPFIAHQYQIELPNFILNLPKIPAGVLGWNNSPRHPNLAYRINNTPKVIEQNITHDLLQLSNEPTLPQFYVLFAWNEWAEGAIIEPNTMYGEEIGFAIKKSRNNMILIQQMISNNKIKFEYGFGENMIDCTNIVLSRCIHQLPSGQHIIFVPGNDEERDRLFSDPCIGIHKIIRVNINETINEIDDKTPIKILLT